MRSVCFSVLLVCCLTVPVAAQSPCDGYPADKNWQAGGPNALYEAQSPFPGWARETSNPQYITHLHPTTVGGQTAQKDTLNPGTSETKLKYKSDNWSLTGGQDLSLTWRVYVSEAATNMPAILLANGTYGIRLQFVSVIGGLCQGLSGWQASEWCGGDVRTKITAGGKLNPIGNRVRYLPMPKNQWHTIRVDLHAADGTFDTWIDNGGSDWKHISGNGVEFATSPCGAKTYVQFGQVSSSSGLHEFATACIAWGEGDAEVPDSPPGAAEEEICDNGYDDADPDTEADCADLDCDCSFIVPENTLATCGNGIDDDADGDVDCADSGCAAITHCGGNQPEYVLTMVRQVGNDNNSGYADTGMYFSVYDEQGNPLNNVTIRDPLNCVSVTTATSAQTSQAGHARYIPPLGGPDGFAYLGDSTTWRFYVSNDQGAGVVNSEITPELYAWLPRPNGGPAGYYSWQVEFMRKSHTSNPARVDPLNKVYMYDIVQMNTPAFDEQGTPRPNDFLDKDSQNYYSYGTDGGSMFGQTFIVPDGVDHIISTRVKAASGSVGKMRYQVSIHPIVGDNPPNDEGDLGPAIGAVKQGPLMPQNQWWDQMVVWPISGQDAVPVEPGVEYFLKITKVGGADFNVWRTVDEHVACGQAPNFTGDFYKYGQGHGVSVRKRSNGELVVGDYGNYDHFLPPHTTCCSTFYDVVGYIVGGAFEPRISLDPSAIGIGVCQTQSLVDGSFTVRNSGSGTINYTISDDAGWLSTVPDNGSSSGEADPIAIVYDVDGLSPGYYVAVIEVAAPEAVNDPQTLQVNLLVESTQADFDKDNDVDQEDFGFFQACYTGGGAVPPGCEAADLDGNEVLDQLDYDAFEDHATGPNVPVPLEYCDL